MREIQYVPTWELNVDLKLDDELKNALNGQKNRKKCLSGGKIYIKWDGKRKGLFM